MRKFSVLRYLKQFSLLIFLFSMIGSLLILFYGKSRQHYIASAVIQYTNEAAKQGYIRPEDVARLIRFRNNPSDESWRE